MLFFTAFLWLMSHLVLKQLADISLSVDREGINNMLND